MTLTEAAAYAHVSPRFLRREIERRRVSVLRIGRLVRFDPDDLDGYLESKRVPAVATGRHTQETATHPESQMVRDSDMPVPNSA